MGEKQKSYMLCKADSLGQGRKGYVLTVRVGIFIKRFWAPKRNDGPKDCVVAWNARVVPICADARGRQPLSVPDSMYQAPLHLARAQTCQQHERRANVTHTAHQP